MSKVADGSGNVYTMAEGHVIDTEITRKKFKHMLNCSRAKSVFEIGFNGGHSARLMLDIMKDDPDFRLHSVDICQHEYTEPLARQLEKRDPRFTFQKADSKDLLGSDLHGYDMLFIDGDHTEDGVRNDLLLALESGIGYILIDDYNYEQNPQCARIAAAVDSFVGDIQHKLCFFGKPLHYECSDGENKMRLCIAYSHVHLHDKITRNHFKKQ